MQTQRYLCSPDFADIEPPPLLSTPNLNEDGYNTPVRLEWLRRIVSLLELCRDLPYVKQGDVITAVDLADILWRVQHSYEHVFDHIYQFFMLST